MSEDYDTSLFQIIVPATSLYDLILQIHERPGMYFDAGSISALENFISGYTYACYVKNINENENPAWEDFHEFVRRHTGFSESTSGWCRMILSVNNQDEAKSLAMFFKLFEAFLASAKKYAT